MTRRATAEEKALAVQAQAPLEQNALTPIVMLDRAIAQGANIETLDKLMGLHERWEANQARAAFNHAIAAARAEMPVILKTHQAHNYKHEDLADIARAVDPILAKHGLSYRWRTDSSGELVSVTCVISHQSGHSEENTLSDKRDTSGHKNPIHGLGSTVSYLQRYTLKSGLGLAAARDDDGAAAAAAQSNGAAITEDQLKAVQAKIKEVNADTIKLCKHLKIEALPDIPASRFDYVMAALEAKKGKGA